MVIVNTRSLEEDEEERKKEENFPFNDEIITLLDGFRYYFIEGEGGECFLRRFNVLMIYLYINIMFESCCLLISFVCYLAKLFSCFDKEKQGSWLSY